ncbi:MAG: PEP-CTERM sorting domain-containing protein [Kiritimatiellaeota bacterium]|nr:PEP-CTERM sorting domain-containing protein [Kiritimatiellota bacterium]
MKRMVLAALCVLAGVATGVADVTVIDWGSQYAFSGQGEPDIFYVNGFKIPTNSTWAVQIVRAATGEWTNAFQTVLQGTPVYANAPTEFWGSVELDGVALQQVPQPWAADLNGVAIFTRLFNNANPLLATMVADVAPTTLTWTPSEITPQSVTYNIGTVSPAAWHQVIPEPGTAAMLFCAAGILALRRARQAKKRR